MVDLKRLGMSYNQLTVLSSAIKKRKKLNILYVRGNPFTVEGMRCVMELRDKIDRVYSFVPASSALPKSCSDLKKLDPNAKIGPCLIDPDGDGGFSAFNVTCDMSDKDGVGVTVISHDSENRTLVDGYTKRGSYSRDIHYKGANISQLVSLIDISQHCEQFIKYECLGSTLKDAFWVSRDSLEMTYWSGAATESNKCACGMNNTCAKKPDNHTTYCNCHVNDNVWREDSGVVTNRTHLPVKQLRFGDTDIDPNGEDELGYHTLGKFKCYGIA
ncbi:neurexin-4-like [Stylophora pistillata]|nr:neurexin-4-like [Stylophora pistillata]